jgi:iron(III) transport system substrate-binding protein
MTHLGEAEGLKLFREIAQTNGFSIRKGHTLLTNLVASGEVALAPSNYNFTTEQVKRSGAPLEWFTIPPTVARVNGVAVAKGSKRPHAAILFYDFVIGEAQPLLVERGFVPVRKDIESPLKNVPIKVIDAALVLDEGEKWQRLYNEIIKIQPR